jgi:selenocysteine-specific elongation factor
MMSRPYRVMATAGHVDHGKSTLVKALTGIDPDRLREEKERQMTIDLGFAWLRLEDGTTLGIVDVPGHRDFIANMLAGVGAVDLVLLVVAADEGVMPQTEEHLRILDLLGVCNGLVAITKVDLVSQEWLLLVEEDVRQALAGTALAEAPLFPVSSLTGEGLLELKQGISTLLRSVPPPADVKRPRLLVDRVFSLHGHGTIVTGTLVGGTLLVGEAATVHPSGIHCRIRSLQSHGTSLEIAYPGSRVAANLVGVEKEALSRGNVLTTGDWLHDTALVDVRLKFVGSAAKKLTHGATVEFYSGTLESPARVRLLFDAELAPGGEGWAQLSFPRALPLASGDRFILRSVSPGQTIGGGLVVDAHPSGRHRRGDPEVADLLAKLEHADEVDRLLLKLRLSGPADVPTVATWLDRDAASALVLLDGLAQEGKVLFLGTGRAADSAVVSEASSWKALSEAMLSVLWRYHSLQPLEPGMSRQQLRRELRLRQKVFLACIDQWLREGRISAVGARVAAAGFRVTLSPEDQAAAAKLQLLLQRSGFAGLTEAEALSVVSSRLLQTMVEQGQLVRLPGGILLSEKAFAQAKEMVCELIRGSGRITVAQARDALSSNRRSTLALLALLDDQGFTRREGDYRVAGRKLAAACGEASKQGS